MWGKVAKTCDALFLLDCGCTVAGFSDSIAGRLGAGSLHCDAHSCGAPLRAVFSLERYAPLPTDDEGTDRDGATGTPVLTALLPHPGPPEKPPATVAVPGDEVPPGGGPVQSWRLLYRSWEMRCGVGIAASIFIALAFWSPSGAALSDRKVSTSAVLAGVAADSPTRPGAGVERGGAAELARRGLPGGGVQGDAHGLEDWAVAAIDAAGSSAARGNGSGGVGSGGAVAVPLRAVARAEVTGVGQVSVAAGEDARLLSFATPVPLGTEVGCLRMQSDPATGTSIHDRVALVADQVGCDAREVLEATLTPRKVDKVIVPGYPAIPTFDSTA
jgi:hypothetical protein